MAKVKVNIAEQIKSYLDTDLLKGEIRKRMQYPRLVVEGSKVDNTETVKFRCLYCGHEWSRSFRNTYWRHGRYEECPGCGKGSSSTCYNIENNCLTQHDVRFDNDSLAHIVFVAPATVDESEGIVAAIYEVTTKLYITNIVDDVEIILKTDYYGFMSDDKRYLFDEEDIRTNRQMMNAFCPYRTGFILTEDAPERLHKQTWYIMAYGYENIPKMFDEYWRGRRPGTSAPNGESRARDLFERIKIPEIETPVMNVDAIARKTISENLLTQYLCYEYLCTACGTRFEGEHRRYSGETVLCPTCGFEQKDHECVDVGNTKSVDLALLSQVDENTLLIRAGCLSRMFDTELCPQVTFKEKHRVIFEFKEGQEPDIHYLANDGYGENEAWRLKKNYASDKFYFHIKDVRYDGDLDILKYTGVREYVEQSLAEPFVSGVALQDLINYIRYQAAYPVLELLCKRKMQSLLKSELRKLQSEGRTRYITLSEKKVPDAMHIPERLVKHFLAGSVDETRLDKYQRLYKIDNNVREEDLEWIDEHAIDAAQIERIFHETEMTVYRLCEYLEHVRTNQCFDPKPAISDWYDYLCAAKSIEVDLSDNKAKYPSSLKREHDRAVAKQKLVLDAKKDEVFSQETERYGKLYGYSTDEYLLLPPRDMKDLFEEGRKLNHCVGSYSDRIIAGSTCILFIRKAEAPDKPYFTIEVNPSDNYVVQLRGLSNRSIDRNREKSLVEFLREWSDKKHVFLRGAA